jgi:ribosomal 30S subunit maturation factor RimM
MNTLIEKKQETVEAVYFLSDLLRTKVLNGDKKIGKLQDIVIVEQGKLPVVTRSLGNEWWLLTQSGSLSISKL